MNYIATLNGKKYEIQIEKVPEYQPLSREEAVATIFTPAPVVAPKVKPVPVVAPKVKPVPPSSAAGETKLLSPMPGSIFDMKVAVGQTVKYGQVLFVLEAMKMENEIVAPTDGTVTSVMVKKGDVVDTADILAVIK